MSEVPAPAVFEDGTGFRALAELAPDVVAVMDVSGVGVYLSPSIERILGYRPGEVLGRPFFDYVVPDDRPIAEEDWARLLASDEIFVPRSIRFRHKNGSVRVLEAQMKRYRTGRGAPGVMVSARDVTERAAHEAELQRAFEEVSDLYDNAPCGFHSLDPDGVVVRINTTELRWLGYERDEVVGRKRLPDLLGTSSVALFDRLFPLLRANGKLDNVELELLRRDGTLMPVLLSATTVVGEDGEFLKTRAALLDITERKLAEVALRKLNRALQTLNAVNAELLRAEDEGALLRNICRVCVDLGGYRLAWVGFAAHDAAKTVVPAASFGFGEDYPFHAEIHWAEDARGRGPTGEAIRTGTVQVNRDFLTDPRMAPWRDEALRCGFRSSIALPLKDRSAPFGALMIYAPEPDAFEADEVRLLEEVADHLAFGVLTLRARERSRRAEAEIEKLAFFDTLTGLPNRNRLLDAMGQAAARLRADGARFALLSINVIHFADIQSGIGVRQADELLRQLADRITQALHDGEMLARIGGEDFAILLHGGDTAHAQACAQRIEQALAAPLQQAGIPITVLVRIGAASAPDDGDDPEALLLHAGIAARQARKKGSSFTKYSGPTEAETPDHLVLISELRAAIEGGQLLLHYQPKVDLASGRIAGVEALVRWQHPERGLVPPGQFIPIAEQTGLIVPLTQRVLEMALHQSHLWAAEGFAMPVAVNVWANIFSEPDFLARLDDMLRRWRLGPESLQLEITESVLMEEPALTFDLLSRLKERGIPVSIDDFGTGYSSLNYVASLPIDALKIDRSFVHHMESSARTRSVVDATIALAQSLGIRTVAEGVESLAQAELLQSMGCSELQGYFLCRPVDAAELRRWAAAFSLEAYGLRTEGKR